MSKFFFGGSSSEEESDVESQNSEDENINKPQQAQKFVKSGVSSDDSDEEDTKRVVKSVRDRRFDELRDTVQRIRNAININDWIAIQNEFDKLNKQIQKANALIEKEGMPSFYYQILIEIEDHAKEVYEKKPSMNANNNKTFVAMRQKIKKHNKLYEAQIENQRKNPDKEEKVKEESEGEEEEEDSGEEENTDWMNEPDDENDKPVEISSDSEPDSGPEEEDKTAERGSKWMLKPAKIAALKEEKEKKQKEKEDKEKLKIAAGPGAKKLKKDQATAVPTAEKKNQLK